MARCTVEADNLTYLRSTRCTKQYPNEIGTHTQFNYVDILNFLFLYFDVVASLYQIDKKMRISALLGSVQSLVKRSHMSLVEDLNLIPFCLAE